MVRAIKSAMPGTVYLVLNGGLHRPSIATETSGRRDCRAVAHPWRKHRHASVNLAHVSVPYYHVWAEGPETGPAPFKLSQCVDGSGGAPLTKRNTIIDSVAPSAVPGAVRPSGIQTTIAGSLHTPIDMA
jgi:hypothetical protein